MCLSFLGRLQTRAVILLEVLLLALVFVGVTGNPLYIRMFLLMVGVALFLDVLVYSRWIGYQPRWLTIYMGVFEFVVLLLLAPSSVTLTQMAGFYVPAWLASWLTMEIVLPWAWPRWAEDGGEFHRI